MQGSRAAKNLIYKKKAPKLVRGYSAKDAAAGKDLGQKGKNFKKIAAEGDKKYGKGVGARIAGSILKKIRAKRK